MFIGLLVIYSIQISLELAAINRLEQKRRYMFYFRVLSITIILLFALNIFAQVKITPDMSAVPKDFKGHDPAELAKGLSKLTKVKLKNISSTHIYGDLTGSDLFAFSPPQKDYETGQLTAEKIRYSARLYPLFNNSVIPEPDIKYLPGVGRGEGSGVGRGSRYLNVIDDIAPLYYGDAEKIWQASYLSLKTEYGPGALEKPYTKSKGNGSYYIPSPQVHYGLAFTKDMGLPLLDSRNEFFDLAKYDHVTQRFPAIGAWTDNGKSYQDAEPLFIVRLAAPYFKSGKMRAMNPVEKQPHVVIQSLFYVEIVGIWMIDPKTGTIVSKAGGLPDVKWTRAAKPPDDEPRPAKTITALKITSRPKPVKPTGCDEVQGTVTLRVTFQADGKIGGIAVVSGLPCGFTEAAVKAVREIQFTPQMRDGVPVTVTKTIQYSFTNY